MAWLLLMIAFPVGGPILFIIFGQNLRKKRQSERKEARDRRYLEEILSAHRLDPLMEPYSLEEVGMGEHDDLVSLLLRTDRAFLTRGNKVAFFSDGKEYFDAVFKAIEGARNHVNVQYYIIRNDKLGNAFLDLLKRKRQEGVEVRLMVDGVGTRFYPGKVRQIRAAGIKFERFFPPLVYFLPFLNHRINYRNHRKIVVVDGRVGFVGGYNVGDEYLGKVRRWGYWRDAALRIEGMAVLGLQLRFLLDWNYISKDGMEVQADHFPTDNARTGDVPMQIVSGGPDMRWQPIKMSYLKMIHEAEESIYIQSPYFVPDESVMDALTMAALSGVDVRIMIPDKPDHPFVHWVSYSYLGELLPSGVRGYMYGGGFIHAKTVVVDGKLTSVGSANWDIRSFDLNFETNAVLYNRRVGAEQKAAFLEDLKSSREVAEKDFDDRTLIMRGRIFVSRLFSDIL